MRPGCDHDAATRLTYDPIGCEVWLDDLAERVGRHQEICSMHAERLTVPRGWSLSDRRSSEPPMFVAATSDPAPTPSRPRRRRRREAVAADTAAQTLELFETLRQELAAVPSEPEPEVDVDIQVETVAVEVVAVEVEAVEVEAEPPAPEPPVAEPPVAEPPAAEPPAAEETPPEESAPEENPPEEIAPDELPASLRATSPLLSRAFAATGHQRSVLTQRGPQAPPED